MTTDETLRTDRFGNPIGPPIGDWTPPSAPDGRPLVGRTCRVERFVPEVHSAALFEEYRADDGRSFTYLPFERPESVDELTRIVEAVGRPDDQLPYAIVVDDRAVGMASYLRIAPPIGSIEVGAICFSPALARTTAATEAMFLMADAAFAAGYRRYEWKCDSLNGPSNAAADRLGFTYEGTFRNAMVYKGRSRDTNWLSITDDEWPSRRAALLAWLDPTNFDATGAQRTATPLSLKIKPIASMKMPADRMVE
jgi:RimJ/RimL family protein N-acetyltransferase